MSKSNPSIAVNVTLFGSRVFADTVKLKYVHIGVEWALYPKITFFTRRNRHTDTYRGKMVM